MRKKIVAQGSAALARAKTPSATGRLRWLKTRWTNDFAYPMGAVRGTI